MVSPSRSFLRRCLLPVALLAGLLPALVAEDEPSSAEALVEVRVAMADSKPPYIVEGLPGGGVEYALAEEALRRGGYALVPVFVGRADLVGAVREGRAAVALGVGEEEAEGLALSPGFLRYRYTVVSMARRTEPAEELADLSEGGVLAFPGARDLFGGEYAEAVEANPDYRETASTEQQLLELCLGIVDQLVIDRFSLEWYLGEPRVNQMCGNQGELAAADLLTSQIVQAAFADEELRDAFTRGLLSMVEDGSFRELFRLYRLQAALP